MEYSVFLEVTQIFRNTAHSPSSGTNYLKLFPTQASPHKLESNNENRGRVRSRELNYRKVIEKGNLKSPRKKGLL
jgi:hypothetical protein